MEHEGTIERRIQGQSLKDKIQSAHSQFVNTGTQELNRAKAAIEDLIVRYVRQGTTEFSTSIGIKLNPAQQKVFVDWLKLNKVEAVFMHDNDPSEAGSPYWRMKVLV